MVKVYYDLIKAGKWRIEDVPISNGWRVGVQALLDADNQEGSA